MAVRPVDLQQVVVKVTDVVRDASVQQQQLASSQQVTIEQGRRHAQRAETVQSFDEAGAAAIHERDPRSGHQTPDDEQGEEAAEFAEETPVLSLALGRSGKAARPRVGRHVDLQA